MKKILSCFLAVATIFSLSACSGKEGTSEVNEDEEVNSNIAIRIYNEDDILQKTINYTTDNSISLYVGTIYIFKIYLSPTHGAIIFTDETIQFNFDSNYISIVDCDLEDEINNSFYFLGLQTTESTLLTISMSAADAPKEINITLIT